MFIRAYNGFVLAYNCFVYYAAGTKDLAPDSLSNSMGLFLQVC
jgi:hypothetical protein